MIALIAGVMTVTVLLVRQANRAQAARRIGADLRAGAALFDKLLDERIGRLTLGATLMADDWAFRRLYGTTTDFRDPVQYATLLSGLENYLSRMRAADFLLLVGMEDQVLGDTRHPSAPEAAVFTAPALLRAAEAAEEHAAHRFACTGDHLALLVAVPILLPEPAGWIVVGFRTDDVFADEFKHLADLDVTFAGDCGGAMRVLASTLAGAERSRMAELPTATPDGELGTLRVDASTWLGLALSLPGEAGTRVILARNMEQELAPHLRIERSLYLLASLTLLLSVVVAARVAHGISRPVSDLTASAGRIEAGDYGAAVPVRGRDELARLAEAFNGMAAGLRERDRVRDLLGKAVSREIAAELLRRPVALGGEEREVTVMFTDVRGFTGYSERIPPTMLVSVLNAYFTRVTRVIERHGGIVDKYIGDAVMAVFGAPLDRPDHAARAIACARDVMRDLDEWNREREARGEWPLRTGIGIATGVVVAGNLGSETRHNYTVMGEAANLAARLQDLTKEHGVPCLIAAETVNRAGAGTGLVALGRIAVRGRSEPIDVFSFATV